MQFGQLSLLFQTVKDVDLFDFALLRSFQYEKVFRTGKFFSNKFNVTKNKALKSVTILFYFLKKRLEWFVLVKKGGCPRCAGMFINPLKTSWIYMPP